MYIVVGLEKEVIIDTLKRKDNKKNLLSCIAMRRHWAYSCKGPLSLQRRQKSRRIANSSDLPWTRQDPQIQGKQAVGIIPDPSQTRKPRMSGLLSRFEPLHAKALRKKYKALLRMLHTDPSFDSSCLDPWTTRKAGSIRGATRSPK